MKKMIRWQDLQASFVVFLVALPLCLGLALASDAPLSSGIIGGIIGGILVGLLGGSEISVSGPANGTTVIVASAMASLGSFELIGLATVMAGGLQLFLGLVRFGYITNFIPTSVIKGMLAAIGIILVLKQIPHAVGFDADFFGDESFWQEDGENTFSVLLKLPELFVLEAVIIAIVSFALYLGWERLSQRLKFFQTVPVALMVVVVSVLINLLVFPLLGLKLEPEHLVQIPTEGSIFSLLNFQKIKGEIFNEEVLMLALTLGLITSVETLLSLDASEKIDPLKRPVQTSRELYAQGSANILSGLLGGLPMTAVIVRTSANVAAGGLYRSSAIFHGLWLLLFTLFFAKYLNMIPLAGLSIVLIFVGFRLTNPKLYKSVFAQGKSQTIPFLVTIIAILCTNILTGVLIGFVVGMFFTIRNSIHSSVLLIQQDKEFLIRFNKDVSFLNKPILKNILKNIPDACQVTIDGSRSVFIDDDIIDIIDDFCEAAQSRHIQLHFKKSTLALHPYFKE